MSQLRDKAAEFEQAGAQILGINVDSFFAHKAFAEKLNLNFPLLSDFNRQFIPQAVGYFADVGGLKQVGRRAVLVVDKQGVVRYTWTADAPGNLPNLDEVLAAARAAA